jgi:SPP1 gp7 family putative phage head morphogenesis protein
MSLALFQHPLVIDRIADLIIKANFENEWDEFISAGQEYENKFTIQMRSYFRQQEVEAIANLTGSKGIVNKYRSEDLIDFYRYQILFEEFEQMMFYGADMYIEITGKDIPEDIKKLVPKVGIIEQWGQVEMGRLGIGISFDVLNPRVIEFVQSYAFRFSWEINAETNQKLSKLLVAGFERGDGIPQYEKNIREMFSWMDKNRANMIARTEVKRAQNFGAEDAYIQSGVVEAKIWWTGRDERVCMWCAPMHGKEMALGENYYDIGTILTHVTPEGKVRRRKLTYEDIKRPPLHVRCRCRIIGKVTI